jgi:hypothetical protein
MARTPRFTTEQVATAITETRGLISYAAQRLACDQQTIRNYIRRHQTVRDALEEARGQIVDLGELRLFQAVDAGESWAVQFLLRTVGRDRGYGDRIDLKADIVQTTKEPQSLLIDYEEYNRAYREAMGIVDDIASEEGDDGAADRAEGG